MTADEMNELFLTLYDKWMTHGSPELDGFHKSQMLSLAQENIIKRRLNPRHGDTFEETEKRAAEFSELLRFANLVYPDDIANNQLGVMPNGVFWLLPDDFFYSVSERCDIEFEDSHPCYSEGGVKEDVMIRPMTHDEFLSNRENPYHMPYEDQVWRLKFSKVDKMKWCGVTINEDGFYLYFSYLDSSTTVTTFEGDGTITVKESNPGSGQYWLHFSHPGYYHKVTLSSGEVITFYDDYVSDSDGNIPSGGDVEGEFLYELRAFPVNKVHELITDDSFDVVEYKIRYLKQPSPIIVEDISPHTIHGESSKTDCELEEQLHPEIVREAVRLATSSIRDSQGAQFENQEHQMKE